MSSPLPPDHPPRSGDWLRLPLPVSGARYLVGTVLALLIFSVVLFTYRRIERELQATLEERLTALLRQHVSSTLDFIEEKKQRTAKVALLLGDGQAATQDSNVDSTDNDRSILKIWVDSGAAQGAFIVPRAGRGYLSYPHGHVLPTPLVQRLNAPAVEMSGVDFSYVHQHRQIYAWSRLGNGPEVLVAAFSQDEFSKRLDPQQDVRLTHSFAFDDHGWLTESPPAESSLPFPAALRERSGRMLVSNQKPEVAPLVGEYQGRDGVPVVGAWVWLSDHQIGVATEVRRTLAHAGLENLRRSFLVLVTLVAAALLGFLALGRWTLRMREESLLMTRRLSRLSRTIQPLSAALEHDPSAVILVDQDGCVIYANAASRRVLGVHEPLIGQDADAVFEALPKELQSALASGQDSIVTRGGDTDGETILVSSHSLTIEGAQHFLYMLRPVTQQVRRQEVEHWKKLIRVLSHELNNALAPITSLLSSARKLNQMTHQDPRLGQIFESISERTAHLVAFIEGYREVARLPRPAPRTVEWEIFLASIESQKQFRLVGEVPKTAGYFDPIQLERVVSNLINNAHEAGSPRDQVELEIVEEDDRFRLNVMDRGSGMPEAVLKQAMLPFFSTKRTGTGVGLALSREIIEAHDGQLALANREGGGLIVSCFLPKAPPLSRGSLGKLVAAQVAR